MSAFTPLDTDADRALTRHLAMRREYEAALLGLDAAEGCLRLYELLDLGLDPLPAHSELRADLTQRRAETIRRIGYLHAARVVAGARARQNLINAGLA